MIFTHLKEFVTLDLKVISMKALITIEGAEFVECYEDNQNHPVKTLQEVFN